MSIVRRLPVVGYERGVPASIAKVIERVSSRESRDRDQQRHYRGPHLSTGIATQQWWADEQDKIIWTWVNPKSMTWGMPLRGAVQKTKGGEVRFLWPRRHAKNKKKIYFDTFPVNIVFQSGNILTAIAQSTNLAGEHAGDVPPGLDDFYHFLELMNEPPLLDDGSDNWHVISYNSPVFPSITLKGWFDPQSLSMAEEAEGVYGVQWSATMFVHTTTPPVWNATELRRMFGSST